MLQLQDVKIQYGDRVLFRNITFQISARDKVALVGRNGVGKSTLLQVITKQLTPDEGRVDRANSIRCGLLTQTLLLDGKLTVRAAAASAFDEILAVERENERLQRQLEERTDYESPFYMQLVEGFNATLEQLNHLDVDGIEKKTELVLKGLGFKPDQFDKELSTLSGGWQMRVELAKLLLQQPDLLMLDEPTNHLDMEAIIWLESYVKTYPAAVMVISHDRAFLRNTADRILEIENSQIYDYALTYDKYLVQKSEIRSKQEAAYRNQQREIAEKERTIKRFMAKASKTNMAQSMQKQLDKIARIELDAVDQKDMKVRFLPVPRCSRSVVKAQDIGKSYGALQVLHSIDLEIERGDRIAIVGQNGQGKTTLTRVLLKQLEPTSGTLEYGTQIQIGYYAQMQSDHLDNEATILEYMELRAPDGLRSRVRHLLGAFLFSGDDVDKKIKVLSGGERARLAFAHMLMQPINLLVLDEPTNHLDLDSKEVLKQALLDYDGTLVVISHDRDFLTGMTTKTFELRDQKMHTYLGDINYFLEKREMEDLRAVSMYKSAPQQPALMKHDQLAQHERARDLGKLLKGVEQKIEASEVTKSKLERDLEACNPGHTERIGQLTQQYAEVMSLLQKLETEWSELVEAMDTPASA